MAVDKRNFWQKRTNWQRGLLVSVILLLIGAIYFAVTKYGYTGTCAESTSPFSEKTESCSFGVYFSQEYWPEYLFLMKVVVEDFWYVVLGIVSIPALIGYFMDLGKWESS